MGKNINTITVSGNVGNADVVQLGQNEALKFSVAYQDSYKDKSGNWVNETTWFNCIKWKPTKTDKENIHKGIRITVEGKHTSKKVEDKIYWTLNVLSADYEVKKNENNHSTEQPEDYDDAPF